MNQDAFVYDLISELRKDPRRAEAVTSAMRRLDMITANFSKGKASRKDIIRAESDLLPLCGFNFGLLIPRFFPRYPYDKPLDFSSRPFMFAMTAMTPGSVITLKAGRQVGKCVVGETIVTTNCGPKTLLEIFDMGREITAECA